VVAEFHADGQTDRTMLIAAFRNSANAPKEFSYLTINSIHINTYAKHSES